MDYKWLEEQVKVLDLKESIQMNDIPNIDLYMDQLITLFESKLSHTKRYEEDKLLTKTMINNYTKDKVIMPAMKKKYTKEHIMLMVILYQLKSIISIGDIKETFSLLKEEEGVDSERLKVIFEAYQCCKEKEIGYFQVDLEKRVNAINEEMEKMAIEDDDIQTALLIFSLIEQANYHKRLAEKIIDIKIKNRQ